MEVLLFVSIIVVLLVAGLTVHRPGGVTHFEEPTDPRPPPSTKGIG